MPSSLMLSSSCFIFPLLLSACGAESHASSGNGQPISSPRSDTSARAIESDANPENRDASPDVRPSLPPQIRDWSIAIEVGTEKVHFLRGDAYQLLDDDEHVVRSIPNLLCQKGPRAKGLPPYSHVRCRKMRHAGSSWWSLTFEKIDYNRSYTLVAHFDPEQGVGGDQDVFAHQSPREIDASNR
jgi:hypothetical protein